MGASGQQVVEALGEQGGLVVNAITVTVLQGIYFFTANREILNIDLPIFVVILNTLATNDVRGIVLQDPFTLRLGGVQGHAMSVKEWRLNQADLLSLLTNGLGNVNSAIVIDPHPHDRLGHGFVRHDWYGPKVLQSP